MRRIFYLFAATVLLATIVSCKTEVTDVQLNKTELTLKIGETETLIATVLPKDADSKAVSWKSSSPETATVDNGKITAKDVGTAIITVTTADGNKTASCTVTVEENVEPIDEPEMIFVQGGTFMFGMTDEEFKEWVEKTGWQEGQELDWGVRYPATQSTVGSFYISKYPVTQKLWEDVMGTMPESSYPHDGDNYPMNYVSLVEVDEFIKKINILTGKKYHIPSSGEWEYAAKGGNKSKGYRYSGSNNLDEVAWHDNAIHPVGTKQPNELDIYDMTGNVEEWVYCVNEHGYGYGRKTQIEEIRGNSWFVSYASWIPIYARMHYIGFRLALSIPEP